MRAAVSLGSAAARTNGGACDVPRRNQHRHISIESGAASMEDSKAKSQAMPVEKTAAVRQRRAEDTRRWRERLHRGAAVYPVEVDGTTFDLMERFGGLKDSKTGDRQAVAAALGKLLRRALEALLREETASRR